jgi:hypothetical protein
VRRLSSGSSEPLVTARCACERSEVVVIVVRRIGALALAVAAVLVWFLMKPDVPATPTAQAQESVRNRSSDISKALSTYELNEDLASSAPQQQVVNGWVEKDLLQIIAEQQNDAVTRPEVPQVVTPVVPPDERIPALVGLVVLGVALFMATTPRNAAVDTRPAPSVVPPEPAAVPAVG